MMNPDNKLYNIFQRRNTTKNNSMKYFNTYNKVIESYKERTPIQNGLIKDNITKMEVQYM